MQHFVLLSSTQSRF